MPGIDIIVIGASAGGVNALQILVSLLPANIASAVFVVMHTSPDGPGLMPQILNTAGPLLASFGQDGEQFQMGRIYVAPPDHHLLIEAPGTIRVTRGPKENRFRPAIDPLFRSAALAFGARVAGVILTGKLDDGTAGLAAVKRRGGIAIVQDPIEAFAPSMPQSALRHVKVDHCVGLEKMAALLAQLGNEPKLTNPGTTEVLHMADELAFEVDIASLHNEQDPSAILKLGEPSLFTCPDCHGTLVQLREKGPLRFRCHTGHAFTAASLIEALTESGENTLWSALRIMEEKIMLLRDMAKHLHDRQDPGGAAKLLGEAQMILKRAQFVRRALLVDEQSLTEHHTAQPGIASSEN